MILGFLKYRYSVCLRLSRIILDVRTTNCEWDVIGCSLRKPILCLPCYQNVNCFSTLDFTDTGNFFYNISPILRKNNSNTLSVNILQFRRYSKKKKVLDFESDSDEEVDVLDKYDKNVKIIKTHLPSMRIDIIIKSGLGFARNKVDLTFYESKIRLNGNKVLKKSQRVNVGDEIDVIKSVSPMNPDILSVARLEIVSATPDEDEIYVKIKRFKTLQIDNYENAPYTSNIKEK